MSTDGSRECPSLPSEIVEKILGMVLGSACKASDFFRLRQVCKQWRDCADDILVSFEKRRSGHFAILFWFSLLLVYKLTVLVLPGGKSKASSGLVSSFDYMFWFLVPHTSPRIQLTFNWQRFFARLKQIS